MKKNLSKREVTTYGSEYSPSKLFEKLTKVASRAGIKTVYAALLLYNALMHKSVPLKDKALVVGALGYLILPIDLIPDLLGPLGFTDDFSVLVLALKTIWDNITPEIHQSAREQLRQWFGEVDEADLKLF